MKTISQKTEGCQAINLYLGSTLGFQTATTIDNDKINPNPFLLRPFNRNKLPPIIDLIKSQSPKKVTRDIYELTPKDDDLFLTTRTYITDFLKLFDQLRIKTAYLFEVHEIEGFPKSETGYDVAVVFRMKSGDIDASYFSMILRYLRPLILPLPTEALDDDYTPSPASQAKQELKGLTQTKDVVPGIGKARVENFLDQDGSQVPEIEKPDHRILPTPQDKKKLKGKPLPWSVGQKLKLAFIPGDFLDSKPFQGISRGQLELYRIHRTFKPKEKGRALYRYSEMGDKQLCGYMKKRKSDLLMTARGNKRKEIERMGTSERSIRNYNAGLLRRGLLIPVYHGWPDKGVARRIVCTSEKQVIKLRLLRYSKIRENREREAKRIKTLKKRQDKPKPDISQLPEEPKPPPGKNSNT